MTEYEKKLEELRSICEWLQEHGSEVDEQDGAVIIAFENPGKPFSACLSASGRAKKLFALHLASLECMKKSADVFADEDEPEEMKTIALQ